MKTMIDKALAPLHFVRAVVGWLRSPEPREAYDIDDEVEPPMGLATGKVLDEIGWRRGLARVRGESDHDFRNRIYDFMHAGPGHRALHDVPPVPNSQRRFAYRYTSPGASGVLEVDRPLLNVVGHQPLFYDPAFEGQRPYRLLDGIPLYV